jgi:hypothetical protein
MPSQMDKTLPLPPRRKVDVRMVSVTIHLETVAQWSHTLGPLTKFPER